MRKIIHQFKYRNLRALAASLAELLKDYLDTNPLLAEVLVLAINRMRWPLTDVAEKYTEDRAANFDIYLPLWLARHNKSIFGSLFVAGELFALWRYFKA